MCIRPAVAFALTYKTPVRETVSTVHSDAAVERHLDNAGPVSGMVKRFQRQNREVTHAVAVGPKITAKLLRPGPLYGRDGSVGYPSGNIFTTPARGSGVDNTWLGPWPTSKSPDGS